MRGVDRYVWRLVSTWAVGVQAQRLHHTQVEGMTQRRVVSIRQAPAPQAACLAIDTATHNASTPSGLQGDRNRHPPVLCTPLAIMQTSTWTHGTQRPRMLDGACTFTQPMNQSISPHAPQRGSLSSGAASMKLLRIHFVYAFKARCGGRGVLEALSEAQNLFSAISCDISVSRRNNIAIIS